jgi:VanZ family protein
MALIFYQSSMTSAPLPGGMNDKVAHASGYALLGILVARAFAGGFFRSLDTGAAASSVAITVLYAASDEWHQRFVPGRTADVADLAADAVGAFAAVAVLWACGILWPRSAERRASTRDL